MHVVFSEMFLSCKGVILTCEQDDFYIQVWRVFHRDIFCICIYFEDCFDMVKKSHVVLGDLLGYFRISFAIF